MPKAINLAEIDSILSQRAKCGILMIWPADILSKAHDEAAALGY